MTLMRTSFALGLAALLLVAPSAASASTITIDAVFHNVRTDLINRPLQVARFDPVLGTLTGVNLFVSGSLTGSGSVLNKGNNTITGNVREHLFGDYQGTPIAGGPAVLPSVVTLVVAGTDIPIGGENLTIAAHSTTLFGPHTVSLGLSEFHSTTDTATLSQFVGAGLFGYEFDTLIAIQSTVPSNSTLDIDTFADALLRVQYDYNAPAPDPILNPEPTSLVLLGTGLAGISYRLYRRKK